MRETRVKTMACVNQNLFIPDLHQPSASPLLLALLFFLGAVVSTCTGTTSASTGRWIYRAEEPGTFWGVVAMYYLGALVFVGFYFAIR